MENLVGKRIKVIHLDNGTNDLTNGKDAERWDGYIGVCRSANSMGIWLEGMSVSILPDCDKYEMLD